MSEYRKLTEHAEDGVSVRRQTFEVSRNLRQAATYCCWHLNSPSWSPPEFTPQSGATTSTREGTIPVTPTVSPETASDSQVNSNQGFQC